MPDVRDLRESITGDSAEITQSRRTAPGVARSYDGGADSIAPDQQQKKTIADFLPSVSLPKSGGAIRGLGEKFSVNAATGTANLALPVPISPARFTPQLQLTYDSGSGNGPFGFGWNLDLPAIRRKTDKGLPRYCEGDESDVFILSGSEDLVPVLDSAGARQTISRPVYGTTYRISLLSPAHRGVVRAHRALACRRYWRQPLAQSVA
jgi:hypothetical protein